MLWNSTSFECVANLTGHTDYVNTLAFLNQTFLLSGSDDLTIKIWNLTSLNSVATLNGHLRGVLVIILARNGYIISGSRDTFIKVYFYFLSETEILD